MSKAQRSRLGRPGFNTADLPRNRESVNNDPKSGRPKSGLKGKSNLTALGKRRKNLISPSSTLNRQSDEEPLGLLVIAGEQVNTAQLKVTELQ